MIDFDGMLERFLHREPRGKTEGRYYPSEIGNCLRKTWFSYKKPKAVEPEVLKIFQVGNLLHDFVVEVLRSDKNPDVELVSTEMPMKIELDDFLISGRVDSLLLVRDKGRLVLVEVKSSKYVEAMKTPTRTHVMQLQLYMHNAGVNHGVVLYLEKNTLKSKAFPIEYDKTEAGKILERFKTLHSHIKENKLPPPEAKQDREISWMCNYCDYQEECGGGG